MARSVTPRRRAPASEVTRPPSNSATSSRPPALPNAIPVALQCVGIGECPLSGLQLVLAKQVLPAQRPRCTTPRERCALIAQHKPAGKAVVGDKPTLVVFGFT